MEAMELYKKKLEDQASNVVIIQTKFSLLEKYKREINGKK
jgi:hypothetical protein